MTYTSTCRGLLASYAVVTWFALILDFVDFVIHYIRFGYHGDEHSALTMLFLSVIFLGLDLFYLAWTMQARTRFPGEIADSITKALYGVVGNMNADLQAMVN